MPFLVTMVWLHLHDSEVNLNLITLMDRETEHLALEETTTKFRHLSACGEAFFSHEYS